MSQQESQRYHRPTIGILPGWAAASDYKPDRYLISVVRGIQSAARVRDCNLLLAWGTGHGIEEPYEEIPAWPVISPDTDFIPVGPWNTDGLIIFAPLLNEVRSQYIQQLIAEGHPILFIATGEEGPAVQVDNEMGIHQAVAHLLEHGHRRIAFIAGDPHDLGDSKIRLSAYLSAMEKNNLEMDPRLIAYGNHDFDEAYLAIDRIIAAKVGFTAVLTSDDNSAFGVMSALKENGLRIPRDVAVVGFDDQPDAIAQIPPLTSIHAPLAEIGQRALEMMADHIEDHTPLASIRVPTRLTTRQSCGCLPTMITATSDRERISNDTFAVSLSTEGSKAGILQELATNMFASLSEEDSRLDKQQKFGLCVRLVEGFFESLKNQEASHFKNRLMDFLYEVEIAHENIHPWQEPFSIIWRDMKQLPLNWEQPDVEQMAEELVHQARVAISESAQRQYYRYEYQLNTRNYLINELNARMSAINNKNKAIELLNSFLPLIGIRNSRVALFEADGEDRVAWSVIVDADPQADYENQRFPSRQFPPPNLFPTEEPLNLALLPLVFQEEAMGYVTFDANDLIPCSTIARHIAATFNSSQLHDQVVDLSLTDALTGLRNRRYFDLFLKNEIDRSQRFARGLAIIILDIDHFKDYNDTFGHPAGDEALKIVAQCLIENRRKADGVARIGGEEFAVILPETNLTGAMDAADRIRLAIAKHTGLKRQITVSLGVSELHDSKSASEILIEQADKALYEAKRNGRNRVCTFGY